MDLTWTDETYRIHEVPRDFKPTVSEAIRFYAEKSRPIIGPIIDRAVHRAVDLGEEFDLELQIVTAKGNLRDVHTRGRVDSDRHRVYGFFQDISEKVRTQAALLKNQKLETLGVFAGGIAHDFNNLLMGIFGYVSLARKALEQGNHVEAAESLHEISDSFNRAVSLTNPTTPNLKVDEDTGAVPTPSTRPPERNV